MGTKLQYAVAFDLLAANTSCSTQFRSRTTIMSNKGLEDNNRSTIQLRGSMDRAIDRRDAEIIRRTMLLHEDIFEHQVKELHRLYTTQKIIMEELKAETRIRNSQQQGQVQEAGPSTAPSDDRFIEECGLDLTLSIGFGGTSASSAADKNKSIYLMESVTDNNNDDKQSRSDQDQRATSSGSNSGTTAHQRKQKRSHWLSQGWT